jgi:hypothetical protein
LCSELIDLAAGGIVALVDFRDEALVPRAFRAVVLLILLAETIRRVCQIRTTSQDGGHGPDRFLRGGACWSVGAFRAPRRTTKGAPVRNLPLDVGMVNKRTATEERAMG